MPRTTRRKFLTGTALASGALTSRFRRLTGSARAKRSAASYPPRK